MKEKKANKKKEIILTNITLALIYCILGGVHTLETFTLIRSLWSIEIDTLIANSLNRFPAHDIAA